jgi:hypothetical protein
MKQLLAGVGAVLFGAAALAQSNPQNSTANP